MEHQTRINSYPWILIPLLFMIVGCSGSLAASASPLPSASNTATITLTQSPSPSPVPTVTNTATNTVTATQTSTPTVTLTPTISPTPTITPTPTFDFPDVSVLMQANCRYGPGTAYLYAHGLYEGDHGEVHGRNYSDTWLWIKPDNLDWHCWVAASVVEVQGDIRTVVVHYSSLPYSSLYGPPGNVRASRDGEQVVVSWDAVWMTDDDYRGYLLEVTTCQNGTLVPIAVSTDDTSYAFSDQLNCSGESGGRLYSVEKHGYSDPEVIPWP
jgi:hypothetical protein